MNAAAVIAGERRWHVECARWEDFLPTLPDDSVDLIFGSPPYEAQRTYGIDFKLRGQDWVDWMVSLFRAASRVCKGLVAMVVEGFTKDYRWSATPALLMADLHRAGLCLRKPPVYHRVGIPGSGGPDWLRNDYEFVVCATRPGKLPWSDNTACGEPPKWLPGGEMSYRTKDGKRRNATGKIGQEAYRNGTRTPRGSYTPPDLANPGNIISLHVGGYAIGNPLCHENEAPFPEDLAAFFVKSFAPPGGIVLDLFSGSGTTSAVAVRHGRRAIACDIRQSQVDLSIRRISGETPTMFPEGANSEPAP